MGREVNRCIVLTTGQSKFDSLSSSARRAPTEASLRRAPGEEMITVKTLNGSPKHYLSKFNKLKGVDRIVSFCLIAPSSNGCQSQFLSCRAAGNDVCSLSSFDAVLQRVSAVRAQIYVRQVWNLRDAFTKTYIALDTAV